MTKIILINGPAGSGKDTVASNLLTALPAGTAEIVKFAAPLKATAITLYCNGDSRKFYEFDNDQEKKNKPSAQFLGKSCRQVQIDLSESYMKPMHGQTVFGELLRNYIDTQSDKGVETFLVSDSGFRPEAEVLVDYFGPQNVLLIRLHREGHTYEGDSRNYIDLDDLDVETVDIQNITDQFNESMTAVYIAVNKFLKGNK